MCMVVTREARTASLVIGALISNDKYKPKYAQLYIYDTHNEIKNR